MIRSAICAGTAALLSVSVAAPAAMAGAPLQLNQFITAGKHRLDTQSKSPVLSGAAVAEAIEAATNQPNVYTGEQQLSALLENPSLTKKQHARVLYARAQHRWKKSSNRIGAWQDFTDFTKLHPDDPYATNAGIEAGYVKIEIDRIERRMQELQTLSIWFEDAWQLGKRTEAAGRYQRSGFAPEPQELEQLQAAGYICLVPLESASADDTRVTSTQPDLHWC